MNTRHWIGLALITALPLHAEEEKIKEGARMPGESRGRPQMGEFIRKADADGDGKVSRAEFDALERISQLPAEKRQRLFRRLDRNDDGSIEGAELDGPPKGRRGPGPMPDLRELDTDKDGTISYGEFIKGRFVSKLPEEKQKRFFDRLDNNKDGKLSPEDHRPGDGPRRIFERLDEDKDGALSFAEFSKAPWNSRSGEDEVEDEYEKLDKNQDGKLQPEELHRGPRPKPGPRRPGPPEGGEPPMPEEGESDAMTE